MYSKDVFSCSFCGATYTEEFLDKSKDITIIQSQMNEDIAICDSCLKSGNELIKKLAEAIDEPSNDEIKHKINLTPSSIKKHLDQWIIGQDKAKKDIATAVYNHYKIINTNKKSISTEIDKSNVLLVGPTGVGKTAIIKALGKLLDIPYVIADANSLTQSGYVGRDVEDMLKDLLEASDGDLDKAQKGIIYMDEIDKLGRKGSSPTSSRDISGEGVQQALLKLVEGGVFDVSMSDKRKKSLLGDKAIKFDTSQVLFIAGGSFEGIEKVIQKRLNKKSGSTNIGFSGNLKNTDTDTTFNSLITQVNPEDLKNFGMLPELLGRFPILTSLEQLTEEAMMSILTEPKNALIKQYKELFAMENISLEVEDEAIIELAKKALEKKIGARALRATVEEALKDAMYIAPDIEGLKAVRITKDSVNDPRCTKFLIGELDEMCMKDIKEEVFEAGI